jgi:amino acid permease
MASQDSIESAPQREKTADDKATSPASISINSDAEKQGPTGVPDLKRKLKARHLQMIAIGMVSSSV